MIWNERMNNKELSMVVVIRRVNCEDAISLKKRECETPNFDTIVNLEWLEA